MYPALTQSIESEITTSNFQNYIHQAQTSEKWKDVEFEGFTLPAQGESKPYCKKWISFGCHNLQQHPRGQHYAQHELKSCKTSNCPLCFVDWINRQANRSARRFVKFSENKTFFFRHIILSPPVEEAKSKSYNSLKAWLNHVLKIANIKTAGIVFHPFRFMDKEKSVPYVSPHFHLLVYGKVTNTIEFSNKTRWIIKNKGDLKDEVSIFNCVRYLLTHSGVRKRTHVIRYFGDISYRKLKLEKEPNSHSCPYCELPLTIFRLKFSNKIKPPPLDYVGLWNPDCFESIDPYDPEVKIPFYRLDEDNPNSIVEELHYSFEEILRSQFSQKPISDRLWKLSQTKFVTSLSCQKLDEFQCEVSESVSDRIRPMRDGAEMRSLMEVYIG